MNKLDECLVKQIMRKVEDNPNCYIYDLNEINRCIHNIIDYMPSNFSLYYAMKANPNFKILKFIKSFDKISGFEIASAGELKKALKFCDGKEIIFTGPAKTEYELEQALKKGIRLLNVETIIEAIRINKIAERENIEKVDILLRINMDYKIKDAAENMGGLSTKMGIDEKEYFYSYDVISKLKHLNVLGIHVFSASGILNYHSAIEYAIYVFDIVKKIEKTGQNIKIIDLGGGFGVDYSGNDEFFDTQKYFLEIKKLIDHYNFEKKEFILELGCYLVASCGFYLSKIVDIKKSKNYKHVIIAGGLNHIPTATLNGKHPFYIVNLNEKKLFDKQVKVENEFVDIDGPLCTAEDKVLWNVYIKQANIGDIVVIRQAGAYCYTAAWLEFLSHDYPFEFILSLDKKLNY